MSIDAYWDRVDAELGAVPVAPAASDLGDDARTFSPGRLTSIGYRVPRTTACQSGGTVSGVVVDAALRGVNHVPDYHDRARYAVLQMILAASVWRINRCGEVSGLLTWHRRRGDVRVSGIVARCLRSFEFLRGRSEVRDIAIQGDDWR
jgi:hypothetical protein